MTKTSDSSLYIYFVFDERQMEQFVEYIDIKMEILVVICPDYIIIIQRLVLYKTYLQFKGTNLVRTQHKLYYV